MPRRVSLPAADDLFRPTADEDAPPAPPTVELVPDPPAEPAPAKAATAGPATATATATVTATAAPRPSGRVRHDEKMTVYVTSEELFDLEHARLSLRRRHGVAVDRGRLVREAVGLVLADLEAHGDDSALVKRLLDR